jgi:hypothetical protein
MFQFSYSKELEKYFLSNKLYVEYDNDIQNVSRSILYIPAVSCLITIAGAMNAGFYVEELDRNFLESLRKIELIMKKCYPNIPFSIKIHIDRILNNSFSNNGYGLLFSGGIDSTVSYIRHRDKKPDLIMVWGLDIPLDEKDFWWKVRDTYENFAIRENVKIRFIKTNMRQCMNEALLSKESSRYCKGLSWWEMVYSLPLLGLCAPITVERIGTILFASSETKEFSRPGGFHPQLFVNRISWADVRVVLDAYEISRQEKIRYFLKNYITDHGNYPHLWVCWKSRHSLNCGKCEKCSRTITELILEGIDPNKCGFNINSNFFIFLKSNLSRFIRDEVNVFMWKDIQQHIPQVIDHNLYDSKSFFEWFKTFDIQGNLRKRKINDTIKKLPLFYVYYKLPNEVRTKLKRLKLGIVRNQENRFS